MCHAPLDCHLPPAFSQPSGLRYHQTTGLMGESWQPGEASETPLLKEREEQGVPTEEGYGWLGNPRHSCGEQGREWRASEPNWAARKIRDLTTPSID